MCKQSYFLDISQLIEVIDGFVFCKDENLHFINANKKFSEAIGFDQVNKIIGKGDFDVKTFTMTNHFKEVMEADLKILTTGEPILGLYEFHYYKNKKSKAVITNKYPLTNKFDEVIGVFGIYQFASQVTDSTFTLANAINSGRVNDKVKIFELETTDGRYRFTKREIDCMKELVRGKTIKQISLILGVSYYTVKTYVDRIKIKLNLNFKSEIITYLQEQSNLSEIA